MTARIPRITKDDIAPIETGRDALYQLEAIFQAIAAAAPGKGNAPQVQWLAKAGAYLAADIANHLDCRHEELLGVIAEGGAA